MLLFCCGLVWQYGFLHGGARPVSSRQCARLPLRPRYLLLIGTGDVFGPALGEFAQFCPHGGPLCPGGMGAIAVCCPERLGLFPRQCLDFLLQRADLRAGLVGQVHQGKQHQHSGYKPDHHGGFLLHE